MTASDHYQMSNPSFFHSLRLTLGDMDANQVSRNHTNRDKRGPDGSVWAETLSKRRPEAQDHFPSPPGPKNPIQTLNKSENVEHPDFSRSQSSIITHTSDYYLFLAHTGFDS